MKVFTSTIAPTSTNNAIDTTTTMIDVEHDPSSIAFDNEQKTSKDCNIEANTSTATIITNVKAIGRWKKIGLMVIVSSIITLLALTIHLYKESREATVLYDALKGETMAVREYIGNTTIGVGCNMYSNNTMMDTLSNETDSEDDGNRELQSRCPVMRNPVVGKGSTTYSAAKNCWDALFYLYCPTSCPVSFNDAIYDRRRRQWYFQCYCGYNGKYDI